MDKIYRRPTQLGDTPKKKKNEKARKRNQIINFRVSENEKEIIESRILVSGLKKSDFLIENCLYGKILVKGNIKSFTAMRDAIADFREEIRSVNTLEEVDEQKLERFMMVLDILDSALFEGR